MSSFQELLALRQKKLAGKYSSPVSMALADTPEGGAGFIIIIITIITITITSIITSHQPIMRSTKPKVGEEESSEDEAAGELSKVNFIFL